MVSSLAITSRGVSKRTNRVNLVTTVIWLWANEDVSLNGSHQQTHQDEQYGHLKKSFRLLRLLTFFYQKQTSEFFNCIFWLQSLYFQVLSLSLLRLSIAMHSMRPSWSDQLCLMRTNVKTVVSSWWAFYWRTKEHTGKHFFLERMSLSSLVLLPGNSR